MWSPFVFPVRVYSGVDCDVYCVVFFVFGGRARGVALVVSVGFMSCRCLV
jgi:hypothetical protein